LPLPSFQAVFAAFVAAVFAAINVCGGIPFFVEYKDCFNNKRRKECATLLSK
jgi:hypothetical protein